jgi:hypothetical protein
MTNDEIAQIQYEYLNGMNLRDIALKYNINLNTLNSYATRYRWSVMKYKVNEELADKVLEAYKDKLEEYGDLLFGDMMMKWKDVFDENYVYYKNCVPSRIRVNHVRIMQIAYAAMLNAYKVLSGYSTVVNQNNTTVQINTIPEANQW